MKRPKLPSPRELELGVENWNLKHAVGCAVTVRMDNGEIRQTRTRSAAQVLSGHSAVIWLEGISGCYLLSRVSALQSPANHGEQPKGTQGGKE